MSEMQAFLMNRSWLYPGGCYSIELLIRTRLDSSLGSSEPPTSIIAYPRHRKARQGIPAPCGTLRLNPPSVVVLSFEVGECMGDQGKDVSSRNLDGLVSIVRAIRKLNIPAAVCASHHGIDPCHWGGPEVQQIRKSAIRVFGPGGQACCRIGKGRD